MPDDRVVHHKLYLHSSKESNWEDWRELGGDDESEAGSDFAYTAYEVCFHTMVNLDTGECQAYGIEGDGGELIEFPKAFRI